MKDQTERIKQLYAGIALMIAILFVGLPLRSNAQHFQLDYPLRQDGLTFTQVKNLIIVPVFINQKGPFNFILDTGVDPLIITDTSIVDASQLNNLRRVKINGNGEGDELTAYISNRIEAKIGQAKMENIPSLILKEDVFDLSGYLGQKIHGLIGYNFFSSFIVKVNYFQSRITFRSPAFRKRIGWNKIDLTFFDNKPYIDAEITDEILGKIKSKLIVDCGASHALSLEAYEGGVYPLPKLHFEANLGVGLSGKINGNVGRVSAIKLGNYTLSNVLTSFPNYDDIAAKTRQKQRTGNLGADILKRFTVVFDYQNAAMYLKKNQKFAEKFEHDMSGLELYADEKQFNRLFVSRVENESPAAKAGILQNDEIIAINFAPIGNYSLDAIINILKFEDGKTVVMEFVRQGKTYIKLLHLKRRL